MKRLLFSPLLIILLHFTAINVAAQKGVNSIYSAYGIGDYYIRDNNANTGMGSAGVALPSINSINEINPASFAWLPKNNFNLEFTLSGLSTKYINERVNTHAGDFSISRVAVSAQILNPIRTVIGLRRFSKVEYYTTSSRSMSGIENELATQVEGNGGLYQVYAGNALQLSKDLSFGINTGFIFGSINSKETLTLNDQEALVSNSNKYYTHGSLSAGFQYQFGKNKNKWMVGAFYEPQLKLNVEAETKLEDQDQNILSQKENQYSRFIFPQKFGAGISFRRQAFTATADIIGHLWESTGYKGAHFTTTDAYSFSAGIKHQFTRKTMWGELPGISLQAGYNRDNSYLIINGRQLVSNAATIGATFPSKNNANFYTIGCRFGSRGIAVYPMVKENFFEFNFNFSLGGMFYKGKKYD